MLAPVLHHDVAQLQRLRQVAQHADNFLLSPLVNEVRLSEHTNSAVSVRVKAGSPLQHFHSCNVLIAGHNCQDDGVRLLHVAVDQHVHVSDDAAALPPHACFDDTCVQHSAV
eukprot:12278-Heterococcus_DN1.PRE.2